MQIDKGSKWLLGRLRILSDFNTAMSAHEARPEVAARFRSVRTQRSRRRAEGPPRRDAAFQAGSCFATLCRRTMFHVHPEP